jgi:hypothetical protein
VVWKEKTCRQFSPAAGGKLVRVVEQAIEFIVVKEEVIA